MALAEIEKAVLLDPAYFVRASSDSDLGTVRQDLLKMLSRLATSALNSAQSNLEEIERQLEGLRHRGFASQFQDLIAITSQIATRTRRALETTSYSDCLDRTREMRTLASQIRELQSLDRLYSVKHQCMSGLNEARTRLIDDRARSTLEPVTDIKQKQAWESLIVWLLLWVVPAILVRSYVLGAGARDLGSGPNAGFFGWLLGIIWPLPWALGGIAWMARGLFGSRQEFWMIDLFYVATAGLFRALILAVAIWFLLRCIFIILPTRRQKKIVQENAAKRDLLNRSVRTEAEAAEAVAAADAAIDGARAIIHQKLRELNASDGATGGKEALLRES